VLAPVCLTAFTFGFITSIASELPALDPARAKRVEVNGYIYAGKPAQKHLAVLRGAQSRVVVSSNRIAPMMKLATVAVEDRRFYEHRAVDVRGIVRAVYADATNKKLVQGGSTITQQFVKNAYLQSQRSIGRKLKEAALAWQLEQKWPKDRILTAYLNTIYYGNGSYGVQQAAQTYFHHGALKLTLAEAALLAGIPSDPSRWDPVVHPRQAKARRAVVLHDLYEQRYITWKQYDHAKQAPLPKPEDVGLPGDEGPAQYFTNYVKQQLVDEYGSAKVYGGGLRVHTSIDLGLQKVARDAISGVLTDPNGPSAALVAIDPRDGRVLAMVGGRNYRASQFNLAVQGERQPGSSFKPFVLATALRDGISPQTTFVSAPTTILAGGKLWTVHNFEHAYMGPVTLSTATTESDNTVYAQLTRLVGPKAIAKTAHDLGITSKLRAYYAIGLGAEAVNPLEMARAYSAFANGGFRIDGAAIGQDRRKDPYGLPRAIKLIEDSKGKVVADNKPDPTRKLDPNTAAMMDQLLSNVVREGTGQKARLSDGRPQAGKTGTTENYGDAWFVGFTPNLVAAVWVGYPNKLVPMQTQYHGHPVVGGTFPALIWKAFAEKALDYLHKPPDSFPSPLYPYASPVKVTPRNGEMELDNGYCHVSNTVYLFSGKSVAKTAKCKPNEVFVPHLIGSTIEEAKARLAAQPLTPTYAYKPARPLQRLDVVVGQYPNRGTLSSYDEVTLVLPRALHGVVPRVVGLTLARAQAVLARRKLGVAVSYGKGRTGRVVSQKPPPGVAGGPDVTVRLVVGGGGTGTATPPSRSATAARPHG
jgi:penicillin-binding protein 1A